MRRRDGIERVVAQSSRVSALCRHLWVRVRGARETHRRRRTAEGRSSSAAAHGRQNVASRGAFEVHMARVHSPGRGPSWESFQISVEGVFQFSFIIVVCVFWMPLPFTVYFILIPHRCVSCWCNRDTQCFSFNLHHHAGRWCNGWREAYFIQNVLFHFYFDPIVKIVVTVFVRTLHASPACHLFSSHCEVRPVFVCTHDTMLSFYFTRRGEISPSRTTSNAWLVKPAKDGERFLHELLGNQQTVKAMLSFMFNSPIIWPFGIFIYTCICILYAPDLFFLCYYTIHIEYCFLTGAFPQLVHSDEDPSWSGGPWGAFQRWQ